MATVLIRKAAYDGRLKQIIFDMLDRLGGSGISRNSRVVIKPNLLAPAPPESAMITHPLVIKAVAEYVTERGARPVISDSPAMGSFADVIETGGIREALKGLDVEFREFSLSDTVEAGEPFRKIEIARDALEADFMINLPKLKTHSQMLLTLGVKNLYGCIVGFRKPEWHFRAGENREMFAHLLVRIYQAVMPSITIMDGILAMEGQGPGKSGTPRELGLVLGSDNAVALDFTVCNMLGLDPHQLLTNKIADRLGLVEGAPEIDGELPSIQNFKLPVIGPIVFGPEFLHGFMRRHLVQRPAVNDSLCRLCGECSGICPAKAIDTGGRNLVFDYDKCIRCYCCIEVCPYAALRTEETGLGKVARRILKKKF